MALLITMVQLAACLEYVPMEFEAVPDGADVTLGISDPQDPALLDTVGGGAEQVVGTIVRRSDSDIALYVSNVTYTDIRTPVQWPDREPVSIPLRLIDSVEERRLDRTRTWVAAGLAVLGVAIAYTVVAIEGGGTDGGSDKPDNGDGEVQ